MTGQIFTCSDGHLFTASWLKLLILSLHFGVSLWTRCPVDHRWRTMTRVNRNNLSESELAEANRHRF